MSSLSDADSRYDDPNFCYFCGKALPMPGMRRYVDIKIPNTVAALDLITGKVSEKPVRTNARVVSCAPCLLVCKGADPKTGLQDGKRPGQGFLDRVRRFQRDGDIPLGC